MGNTKDARDDDAGDTGKHVGDGGNVGGGEGVDDYVVGADGVAVVHGVRMVPFYMNMPALIGWEKGGVAETGRKVSGKSGSGEGAMVQKEAKKPGSSVVDKASSGTGKGGGSMEDFMVGACQNMYVHVLSVPERSDPIGSN